MTPYEALREILLSSQQISSLVGQRVRPDRLDAEDTLPAIVMRCQVAAGVEFLAAAATRQWSCTIDCRAEDRIVADQLAAAVQSLDGATYDDGAHTWTLLVSGTDDQAVLAERESDQPEYLSTVGADLWRL